MLWTRVVPTNQLTACWYIVFMLTENTLESRLGCILPGWVFILSSSSLPLYWASLSSCMAYLLWIPMCQGRKIQHLFEFTTMYYYHIFILFSLCGVFTYVFQSGDMWRQPEHHHVSTVWWSVWLLAAEYGVLTGSSVIPLWQWSHCPLCYFHVSMG